MRTASSADSPNTSTFTAIRTNSPSAAEEEEEGAEAEGAEAVEEADGFEAAAGLCLLTSMATSRSYKTRNPSANDRRCNTKHSKTCHISPAVQRRIAITKRIDGVPTDGSVSHLSSGPRMDAARLAPLLLPLPLPLPLAAGGVAESAVVCVNAFEAAAEGVDVGVVAAAAADVPAV